MWTRKSIQTQLLDRDVWKTDILQSSIKPLNVTNTAEWHFLSEGNTQQKKRDKPSRRLLVMVLAPSYIFMKIQGVCLHYALIFIALTFVLATYLKCLVTRNLHFSRKIIAFTTILYIKYNEGLSGEGSAEWAILFAPSPSSISWGRQQIALPLALGPVLDCETELFIAKMPQPCAMTLGHR